MNLPKNWILLPIVCLPLGRTYPIGLDVEVCSFAALEKAWLDAAQGYEREHVMPYLYHVPGRFKVLRVDHVPDYGHLRWTVDTPADLELIQTIVNRFGGRQDFPGWMCLPCLSRNRNWQTSMPVSHKKH